LKENHDSRISIFELLTKTCNKNRRLQAPTPQKPTQAEPTEKQCKSAEERITFNKEQLKIVVEKLKKQECKIPEEPESNCESDCKKAKNLVVNVDNYIEK